MCKLTFVCGGLVGGGGAPIKWGLCLLVGYSTAGWYLAATCRHALVPDMAPLEA